MRVTKFYCDACKQEMTKYPMRMSFSRRCSVSWFSSLLDDYDEKELCDACFKKVQDFVNGKCNTL